MQKRYLLAVVLFFIAIASIFSSGNVESSYSVSNDYTRIVSLGPNITETIYALNKGDYLVGRTDYCDYPEEALSVQSVGDLYNPSLETIVSLNPDIVICSSIISQETIKMLENAGLKVVTINPHESLEGTYDLIMEVGKIVGDEAKAEELCISIKNRISVISEKVDSSIQTKKTVYYCVSYGEWGDFTATGDTYISDILEAAGGVNIAKNGKYWMYDKESLFLADPNLIILPVYSYSNPENDILYLTSVEPYSNLSACKQGGIKLIEGNIMDRQGPRVAEAVEEVFNILYPELIQ